MISNQIPNHQIGKPSKVCPQGLDDRGIAYDAQLGLMVAFGLFQPLQGVLDPELSLDW